MTTNRPPEPIDDDTLATLVRDVADGWTMPPVRLEAAGWRARVRSPREQRIAALRHASSRLGQALGAAAVLTVVAALLGVYLSSPHDAGKPANSSQHPASERPRPSGVAASLLPELYVQGDLPSPARLLVQDESTYQVLDLATGTLGPSMGTGGWGSAAWAGASATVTCVCVSGDGQSRNGTALVQVSFITYAADGTASRTLRVGDYRGTPDPRDPVNPQSPQEASVYASHPAGVDVAYVGWSVHAHPVWHSGIDVVDATGGLQQRLMLPDRGDGEGNQRVAAEAPRVLGSTGDGQLLLARPWHSWSPPTSASATFQFGTDVFAAAQGTSRGVVAAYDPARECGADVALAGPRPSGGGTWLACRTSSAGSVTIRLIDPDDTVRDVQVVGSLDGGGEPGGTTTLSPDGKALFLWDPTKLVLTRVDLASGAITTAASSAAAVPFDGLAALGRWLVPATAAKVILSSGIAISPDGTRAYVLGLDPGSGTGDEFAGSTGILVFDTGSMTNVGRWQPTADFVSLAVSPDGRFVYAAGSPRYSAEGRVTNQPASVTVFDAGSGTVRLIAGRLGNGFLLFPTTTLP